MEPFLAVGQLLKLRGHDVVCTMPEQFGTLVEETGLRFKSIGPEFVNMLDSEDGKKAMGGGGGSSLQKLFAMVRLARLGPIVNRKMIERQRSVFEEEKPDRIVCNGKSTYPFIYQIEGRHLGVQRPAPIVLLPIPYMHYVKGHAHLVFNRNLGSILNKLTFKLTNFGLIQSVMSSIQALNLACRIKRREVKDALFQAKTIYTISPTLFPRPSEWPSHLQVLGYHERTADTNWTPLKELEDFLSKSEKTVFITFGSMTNPAPEAVTRLFMTACEQHGIQAIFNTAAGGLAEPKHYDKNQFHFLEKVPYAWIFPKVYAVIHHGGSGTTHTALKYGCASMVIPHIIDQFAWNDIISSKGAGPKGPSMKAIQRKMPKIKSEISELILALLSNSKYKEKSLELSTQIKLENYKESLLEAIEVE